MRSHEIVRHGWDTVPSNFLSRMGRLAIVRPSRAGKLRGEDMVEPALEARVLLNITTASLRNPVMAAKYRLQSVDWPEDLGEQGSWHCDLGYLIRERASMADELSIDLYQLIARRGH